MMELVFKFAYNVNTVTSRYAVVGLLHKAREVISSKYITNQHLKLSRSLCYLACGQQQGCREESIAFTERSFKSFDSAEKIKHNKARAVTKFLIMPSHCYHGVESINGTRTDLLMLGQHSSCFLPIQASLVQPCQVRHYSIKKSKSNASSKNKARILEDQDSSDEGSSDTEEELEEDDDEWRLDEDEVDEAKKDWKDLKMSVPSLRIDAILSAGLGISRKKVEDAFLSAKLRHNGNKVTKKSKQVVEGDSLDIVRDEKVATKDGEQKMVVMRVAVMRVKGERSASDRIPIRLRRWKRLEVSHKK